MQQSPGGVFKSRNHKRWGLISYGNDVADAYRRAGLCVGRLLNRAKPSDLPIDRAVELVINLATAKTLKFDVPAKLLALTDEVIE
jgi:putative ABC transport system substrate-binding protein